MFRGIILGDNPAGHCFLLRDIFAMSSFKLVMVVLLKIYAAGKIFCKISLKVIRDAFFSNMWSAIRRGIEQPNFLVGMISNRRGKFNLNNKKY